MDPSLTSTGVADSADRFAPFTLEPKGRRGMERLEWIVREVERITRGADLVVIEGYSYASKYYAHQMGELGGVIRLNLYCHRRPYVDIPPAARMKIATGSGQARKEAVLLAASRRLEYQGTSSDEADALWLLELALQHYELPGRATLPAKHLEKLAKSNPDWPALEDLEPA